MSCTFRNRSLPSLLSLLLLLLLLVVCNDGRNGGCSCQLIQPHMYASTNPDFYQLSVSDATFVDKSAMIEEYLRNPARVILITRPRRWGKTTNAFMLKRFLEIEINRETGYPLPVDRSINRKLFVGGQIDSTVIDDGEKRLIDLKPLKISRSDYSLRHQGRYPVIFASFSTVGAANYEGVKCFLKWTVEKMFTDRDYLRYADNYNVSLNSSEMETLNVYLNKSYTDEQLSGAIEFLSRLLYKYHGRKVHLLIDEFDTPLISLFANLVGRYRRMYRNNNNNNNKRNSRADDDNNNNNNKVIAVMSDEQIFEEVFASDDMRRTMEMFKNLFSRCLRFNNNNNNNNNANDDDASPIEKTFISGIMRMKRADLFEDIDERLFREYTILDRGFSDHYGFTEEEVKRLLTGLSSSNDNDRNAIDDRRRTEIESRYGWYNTLTGKRLYNPWSVRNYLEYSGKLRYYWTNSAYTRLVEDVIVYPNVQQHLQRLTEGHSLNVAVRYPIVLENSTGDDFYAVLLFIGHLTTASMKNVNDDHRNDDGYSSTAGFNRTYELVIPNKEVKNVCLEKVLDYWY